MTEHQADTGIGDFDAADPARLRPLLLDCLAAPEWADRMLAGRPYGHPGALYRAARVAGAELGVEQVRAALAGHPRIGERAVTGWSATEQSGVDSADGGLAAALRAGNAEYEGRFGHVFLVCATGRSGAEILANLRERLGNDEDTEAAVVRDELTAIAVLRLQRVLAP